MIINPNKAPPPPAPLDPTITPGLQPSGLVTRPPGGPRRLPPPSRPPGVPDSHHLMWVEPQLARDLHNFYSQQPDTMGHVIPHDFAPAFNQFKAGSDSQLIIDPIYPEPMGGSGSPVMTDQNPGFQFGPSDSPGNPSNLPPEVPALPGNVFSNQPPQQRTPPSTFPSPTPEQLAQQAIMAGKFRGPPPQEVG